MQLSFVKYQGTGNDFILIDGRKTIPNIDVKHWCHRRYGIGADGLMILTNCDDADFEMVYYNSDGNLSSMCGNGGRCIAHWAYQLGIRKPVLTFKAPDGFHRAEVNGNQVKLSMNPVSKLEALNLTDYVLDTGSPHYVRKTQKDSLHFIEEARNIRHSEPYNKDGINVNFYQELDRSLLRCRTFERGVEDETYSCGTGVTAVALSHAYEHTMATGVIQVNTMGGDLKVHFQQKEKGIFDSIFLEGPATFVFEGFISL